MTATAYQCSTCPWKKDSNPLDIPNGYRIELHEALAGTIAVPGEINIGQPMRAMACHYSPVGKETPCAGWMHNQIGPGNNIALRIEVMRGRDAGASG